MSDVSRLLGWFSSGLLLRPEPSTPGTVHLARAIAALCGAPLQLEAPALQVADVIGESPHYVFVLGDGLGMNLVESLSPESFLRRHLALELASTFPSSTAPALTSIGTGLWPGEHGVPGWLVYLRERDLHTVTLPFIERSTSRPLSELGLTPHDLFVSPPLWASLSRDTAAFIHRRIADSAYTRYVCGGHKVHPYDSLESAADAISARVATTAEPAFSYFYYSAIDTAVHIHGPSSREVAAEVTKLDSELSRLEGRLNGQARILVSADHGSYDVRPGQKLVIEPDDDLSRILLTPPAGESPVPSFHVRPGHEDEFAAKFRARAGDTHALLTTDEVDELRLFGPKPLSPITKARLGDFIALSAHGEAVVYSPETAVVNMKGFHGGLTPTEVRIPLVVA
jgi:Type I phosphodiesterase / nucleotide pyrophosphatase